MTASNTSASDLSVRSLTMCMRGPGGEFEQTELSPGTLLVIGTSRGCRLRLTDPQASAMHCTVTWNAGCLTIRDWDTELGTTVNGESVQTEIQVAIPAVIQIGGSRIEIQDSRARSSETGIAPPVPDRAPATQTADVPTTPANDSASGFDEDNTPPEPAFPTSAWETNPLIDEPFALPNLDDASDQEQTQWANQEDTILLELADATHSDTTGAGVSSQPAYETEDLLRAEIELLQSELLDRDTQLAELRDGLGSNLPTFDASHATTSEEHEAELEQLTNRMEQLLDELEQADLRTRLLEDQLQSIEQLRTAERAEYDAVVAWIDEIEQRFGEREAAWEAEREALEQRVAQFVDGTTREMDPQNPLDSPSDNGRPLEGIVTEPERCPEAAVHELKELRQKYRQVAELARNLKEERDNLAQRLEQPGAHDVASGEPNQSTAGRQETLEIAQARAELAREQTALLRLKEDFERKRMLAEQQTDSADQRVRAFREHLREVHATQEQQRKDSSLANRLSRLWRRLEGR